MASSNFVDYVKIFCRSGKGGAGSRHFIRTQRTPKGGPDGGDGGRGGHIILEADKKKIFFVNYKSEADLVIYFTNYKSDAGWRNKSKQHLMF